MHSEDVVHSFWVPQLGGKRDVNPLVQKPEGGVPKYNWLHFTINEAGVYRGQCAEFCGSSHALMGTYVFAEPEEDFEAWLNGWRAEAPQPTPEDGSPPPSNEEALVLEGRQVFQTSTCIICHAIQGTPAQGRIGPDLTLFGTRGTLGAGWLENTQANVSTGSRIPRR
jgi:cytochrome c oxidase subunit 2